MKKFTMLLSFVLVAVFAFGQDQDELRRVHAQREALLQKELQQSQSVRQIKDLNHLPTRAIECMPEATYSNPPVDFETGTNSSVDAGYRVAHRVEGFDSPISAIRIFGIQALFSGGWSPANGVDPLNFEVKFYNDNGGTVGSEITAAAQTVALNHVNTGETFATSYIVYHWDFVPESPITGLPSTFWVSFANTDANAWFLWIDQPGGLGSGMQYTEDDGTWDYTDYGCGICLVPQLAEPEAPEAPTSFRAVPADLGVVYADIFWTNPSKTVAGDELTELTSVSLFLSGEEDPIYVNDSPVIGGEDTFAFTGTDVGMYTFSIYGTNSAGDGLTAGLSVWLGPDAPAAPTNVLLTGVSGGGHITWTAPNKGVHGGYIDPAETRYKLVRMPGAVVVAEDLEETEYTDIFNPSIGNYHYTVTASNEIGEGGTGTSNIALLGAEGILLYEPFTGITAGQLPAGWTVDGLGASNWSVQSSNYAGGTAPELRLYWSPSFNGVSRLVTHTFGTDGREELRLKFRQYLSNFSVTGQTLAVQAAFDNGDWVDVWTHTVTGSLPAQLVEVYFDVPAGASTMKICFKYEGDVYQINNWNIDDVILEPVVDNDLVAVSLAGSATPTVGMEFVYTVTVNNAGTATQNDYSVKLMKAGGVELASVAGEPIEFTETQQYQLTWIPAEEDEGPMSIYGFVDFEDDEVQGNNQTALKPIVVQPEGTVVATIGEGDMNLYMPFNMLYENSVAQTLYYPEEIGIGGGIITGLQYTNSFDAAYNNKDIKIYLGETDLTNLSSGFVDPSTLQLVYEGTYDFPAGNNDIFIPLDDFYAYGGGNLVVYTWRGDTDWTGSKYFKGSTSAGSNRSYRAQQDYTPIDPMNPPSGLVNSDYPNIKIFFSTAGLGALEGTVTDGTDPLEGVLVRVLGTNSKTYTAADGTYSFPYLIADTYDVEFSLHGYFTYVEEDVLIEEDETTQVDVELDAIPQYTVSGTVMGNDDLPVEGATVNLAGYDDYSAVTNADGEFTIANVYEGTYTVSVSVIGYDPYVDEVDVDDDIELEIVLIETIVAPANLAVVVDDVAGTGLFTWSLMAGVSDFSDSFEDGTFDAWDEFIQGNGVAGDTGNSYWYPTTSPDGGVVPNGSYVARCDWGYNIDTRLISPVISVQPDANVIFNWYSSYYWSVSPNPNAQLTIEVSTDNGSTWTPIWNWQDIGVWTNFTWYESTVSLNAYLGQAIKVSVHLTGDDNAVSQIDNVRIGAGTKAGTFAISTPMDVPANLKTMPEGMKVSKALVGFNVYLDGELQTTEGPIEEEEFLFTGLVEGNYVAGVRSVYTTGESDIVTLPFELVYGVPVTVEVSTNSGDDAEGAQVVLVNEADAQFTYTATVGEDGTADFASVRKGVYTLTITLAGFETYTVQHINIQEEMTIEAELVEIIVPPFGLVVEPTENAGEMLFSWNNILGTEMFENFEGGGLPSGWSQVVNNYDQSGPSPGTWTVTNYSSSTFGPFGTYHVGLWWSYDYQDEWLITPELNIGPTYELEFWSAVYFGSTNGDHYYVKVSTDGGNTWTAIWDASALSGEWNYYNTPIVIDLAAYSGQNVHFAFHAEDPPSNDGLWYVWFIDNVALGPEGAKNTLDFANFYRYSGNGQGNYSDIADVISRDGQTLVMPGVPAKAKSFVGYNVYLDGILLTDETITEEEYLFTDLINGEYIAGVQAVYTSGESEIVTIAFNVDNGITSYTATFNVTNKAGDAIEGATITIDNGKVLTTDAQGVASVALADGTYGYSVDAGNEYNIHEGQFVVDGANVVIPVVMVPVGVSTSTLSLLQVYPNPFNDFIYVDHADMITRVVITNLIGQVVMETPLNNSKIETANLDSGVYLVTFITENGERVIRKMIKR